MKEPLLRVKFYERSGSRPVRDWLPGLEPEQRKEIGADMAYKRMKEVMR